MGQNNKQKKRRLRAALGFITQIIIGGVIGYFVGAQVDQTGLFGLPLPEKLIALALMLLGIIALLMLVIIIHEAGHLVFGLLSGYRFVSFRVMSLMWIKRDGRLRLKRLTLAGTGGQCLMAPPEMVNGRFPVVLYNLGGAIMNLLSVPVFLGLWFLVRGVTWLAFLTAMGAALSLATALFNAIPLKTKLISNDGHNALELGKNPQALRAFWLQLTINAYLVEGARLRDLPEEWFVLPSEEDMQNGLVASLGVICANRLMDERRFAEADRLMAHLTAGPFAVAGLHRGLMMCDRIYCELIGENRLDVIDAMMSRQQKKLMKAMGKFITVARTQYALAVLRDQDGKAAVTWKARFEKIAASSPYPGDTAGERELVALVEQKE